MKKTVTWILKGLVKAYRILLSPLLGPRCRFYPTCSAYMFEALDRHGSLRGLLLGLSRLLRCHPWCRTHWHDPVPKRFTWGDVFGYKRTHKSQPCDHQLTAERRQGRW